MYLMKNQLLGIFCMLSKHVDLRNFNPLNLGYIRYLCHMYCLKDIKYQWTVCLNKKKYYSITQHVKKLFEKNVPFRKSLLSGVLNLEKFDFHKTKSKNWD